MTDVHAVRVTKSMKNENSTPTILNCLRKNTRDNKTSSINMIYPREETLYRADIRKGVFSKSIFKN